MGLPLASADTGTGMHTRAGGGLSHIYTAEGWRQAPHSFCLLLCAVPVCLIFCYIKKGSHVDRPTEDIFSFDRRAMGLGLFRPKGDHPGVGIRRGLLEAGSQRLPEQLWFMFWLVDESTQGSFLTQAPVSM